MAAMFGFIAAVNAAGWGIFVWRVMPHHFDYHGLGGSGGLGVGLGVAVTAWFLGFRHAFDADHISCIDNTTRKLMAECLLGRHGQLRHQRGRVRHRRAVPRGLGRGPAVLAAGPRRGSLDLRYCRSRLRTGA
jgi:hypothetical protein